MGRARRHAFSNEAAVKCHKARDTEPELRISTAVGILVVLLALVILFAAIAFLVTT